jgi:hypothetical protein
MCERELYNLRTFDMWPLNTCDSGHSCIPLIGPLIANALTLLASSLTDYQLVLKFYQSGICKSANILSAANTSASHH